MFGKKLKSVRKYKGYTLEELADLYNKVYGAGLNKGTLSKYENGKQEPMITVVKNLAAILDVSLDYLLEDDNLRGIMPEPLFNIFINLLTLLKIKKVSDEELSSYLNLPLSSIHDWKKNLSFSYLNHLPEIAEFFGISLNDLLGADYKNWNKSFEEYKAFLIQSTHETSELYIKISGDKEYDIMTESYYPKSTVSLSLEDKTLLENYNKLDGFGKNIIKSIMSSELQRITESFKVADEEKKLIKQIRAFDENTKDYLLNYIADLYEDRDEIISLKVREDKKKAN